MAVMDVPSRVRCVQRPQKSDRKIPSFDPPGPTLKALELFWDYHEIRLLRMLCTTRRPSSDRQF
jgi:hypothetical protein